MIQSIFDMKKYFFELLFLSLLLAACQKEQKKDPFLISKTHVGLLTKEVQVRQLDSIFKEDSVVVKKQTGMFDPGNEIVVFDQKGTQLLVLEPVQDFDSTSTIGNIQVIDPRFKTQAGFGPNSTFKDIIANYSISRIEITLDAVVVFIDEINAYVTIKKTELPMPLQHAENIEPAQIPETAKINYFWIGWQ